MEHRDIRQLFKKYTKGTISGSELHTLREYFGTALHEAELKELMLAYFAENDGEDINDRDALEIASEARPSVLEYARTVKNRRVLPWKWIIAAAVLIATFSLSLWIYRKGMDINIDNELARSMHEDLPPGTNKATLKLSNGRTIELSGDKSGVIIGDSITYNDGAIIGAKGHIEYATLVTPRSGQYQITLPDGTKVWLNAESSLTYPLNFSGKAREVEMTGEAYFDVTHRESQPFIVTTGGQTIQVLGTQFNINAYGDEYESITTLVNGSIRLSKDNDNQSVTLTSGQQAVFNGNQIEIQKVNAYDYSAWKDGLIVLSEADLPSVARQLERWYDVDFDIESLPGGQSLNGEVPRNTNLSGILNILELNTGLKFKIEGRRVVVENN